MCKISHAYDITYTEYEFTYMVYEIILCMKSPKYEIIVFWYEFIVHVMIS